MRWISILLASAVLVMAADKKPRKKQSPAAKGQSSLTGCLDQRGELYVLRSESDMRRVSTLKGKGFSEDNFARYIGHKVTVYGQAAEGAFDVVRIENVADTCSSATGGL